MNAKVLILGAVVTAFAFTSMATEPLLSPRAAGNQIKFASSSVQAPAPTAAAANSGSALLSPRAAGNQIKVLKDTLTGVNPALFCSRNMVTSPRAAAECASHTTMPGCVTLAQCK
jgi:hypothetical protein